ncbi:MAG: lysophospholipid acyltransferase family protein [Pseudomonadota bacterium]
MVRVTTSIRVVLGLTVVAVAAMLQTAILLALLPSRRARIRSCIVFERIVGYSCTWLTGCRLTLSGREHLDSSRPAIYVANHTSIVDLFIMLRIMPGSAVGIAKKEVVRYPFFGQMYLLTGHLRLDRGRHGVAIASLKALGELVQAHGLSIAMAPEGTRARDGRLQPFKKGMVHLALQTGLPVVPIIIQGAHRVWLSDTLTLRPAEVVVEVLPAVSTAHWSAEDTDGAVDEIHAIYRNALPSDQLPLPPAAAFDAPER